jgi:NADPH:quinone reductase-like Zn-dependent oxidoreductase
MSKAVVLTEYGAPDVLRPGRIDVPDPGEGQIRIAVKAAGVGPTDLAIRAGHLKDAFPLPSPGVLGFEAAGTVDAVGPSVTGVSVGDEVAVLLPSLGGYAETALASRWVLKPASVSWEDAAALPASAEAAIGVLDELQIGSGDTLLILGAAGAVGLLALQLAVARGATVIGAVRAGDFAVVAEFDSTPVHYGENMVAEVRAVTGRVDAVLDAAGRGGLPQALELTGGAERVISLSDPRAAQWGVRLSAPTAQRAPKALEIAMPLLESKVLRLKPHVTAPLAEAADVHRKLESGEIRSKVVLLT